MNTISSFQFLRFLAFLLIFSFHSGNFGFLPDPGGGAAASAVSFFILLSGFLSGYTSTNRTFTCSIKETLNYLYKKLKKFYPLYILTTAVTVLYSGLKTFLFAGDLEAIFNLLSQLIKNIFLIQSWFPTGYFSFNSVSWFLSTMMFLYLFKVPITYFINKINSRKNGAPALLGLLLLFSLLFAGYCHAIGHTNLSAEFYLYIFPPARILEFIVGIICGFLMRIFKSRISLNSILYTFLEFFSLFIWFYAYRTQLYEWECRSLRWFFPNLLILCTFSLNSGILSRIFSLKYLKHLGDISFECYLLHQIILTLCSYACGYLAPLLNKIFYTDSLITIQNAFLQMGCLTATLLLSHLIYIISSKQSTLSLKCNLRKT